MSVTKTITTSKPFYVVAGAGDLAVKTFRDGTDKLSGLRIERKDIESGFASLQTETKALPAKAQTVAVTLVADVAGKVGTGYDQDTLEMLRRRLSPLHRRTSPFAPGPVPAGEVQWVTPKLVAQIGFGEWTEAGLLRHPRYLGLRDDKTAREVRREEPKTTVSAARRRGKR